MNRILSYMVEKGSEAPDFTAPLAGGDSYNDVESFTLSEAIGSGPIVLAFYPAAFTSGCTEEMCAFRDSMSEFDALDAQVYGLSVDLPFSQNVWIMEHELGFPMVSDWNHEIIREYEVVREDLYGVLETARRSIFVLDEEGTVVYKWVREGENPDFRALISTLRDEITTGG